MFAQIDTSPDTKTQVNIQDANAHKVEELLTPKKVKVKTKIYIQSLQIPIWTQVNEQKLDIQKEDDTTDNKVLRYVVDTRNNKKIEIKSGKIKCNLCETEFTRHDSLERHLLRHREKNNSIL